VDVHALRNIHNHLHVRIIIIVRAARHLDVVVRHADVVRVGRQVLWRGHDGELDGALIAEGLVGPFPHRADLLDCGNTVIGNQDLWGGAVSVVGGESLHRYLHL
jgi:hypothetical protein